MILSDWDIVQELFGGNLKIIPSNEDDIQPCSVDLHLGEELKTIDGKTISLVQNDLEGSFVRKPYNLQPNEFILGSTEEYVELPNYLCGQVEGRSSIGRLGVMVHITAGFIDSGFKGNITLEIYNASDKPFPLIYGESICQLVIHALSSECIRPYGSEGLNNRYQDSVGVVNSKYESRE